MTDSEAELLFLAIDRAEVQQVGITRLASLELNNLHRAPWCFGGSSLSTTLLDFAAWRGRDIFSCQLIAAGADPSEGVVSPNVWEKLPRAYVAWLARAAARLRRQLSASSVCVCGKMPSMLFLPCGHANCASCIWRQFESFHFGPLPELICAQCNATFDDPSMTFLAQRRGIIRRDPTSKSESNQICAGCGCLNIARAVLCINCGWTLSQPRFTTAPKASPPPSCFDWLIHQMIGKKSRYSVRERQERKLQSLQRWKELPEEMQASQTFFFLVFCSVYLFWYPGDVEFAELQDPFGVSECFSLENTENAVVFGVFFIPRTPRTQQQMTQMTPVHFARWVLLHLLRMHVASPFVLWAHRRRKQQSWKIKFWDGKLRSFLSKFKGRVCYTA